MHNENDSFYFLNIYFGLSIRLDFKNTNLLAVLQVDILMRKLQLAVVTDL